MFQDGGKGLRQYERMSKGGEHITGVKERKEERNVFSIDSVNRNHTIS